MHEEMKDLEVWRENVQRDIADLKNGQTQIEGEQSRMKDDIYELKLSDNRQQQDINMLKETLTEIKADTRWIRRKITGAFITALITAVVAGLVGIAISKIF